MAMPRLNRPGLDEYIRANYGKVPNTEIAEKFFVTRSYVSNRAQKLGVTKKVTPAERASNGLPAGYKSTDVVGETNTGIVLKVGNVTRHSIRG